jgi:hypothetical protein
VPHASQPRVQNSRHGTNKRAIGWAGGGGGEEWSGGGAVTYLEVCSFGGFLFCFGWRGCWGFAGGLVVMVVVDLVVGWSIRSGKW